MYRGRRNVCGISGIFHHVACCCRLVSGGGGGRSNSKEDVTEKSNNSSDRKFTDMLGNKNGGGDLPPGFDMHKLRVMQDMISSQPLDKQMEMMKKALEFQKTLGKIPGVGRLAQKNVEVMEHLLKNVEGKHKQHPHQESSKSPNTGKTEGGGSGVFSGKGGMMSNLLKFASDAAAAAAATAATTASPSSSSHSAGSRTSSGPTIDELKKVNLGPEIEALFAELAAMRAKKNSYRDKLHAKEEELEKLQKEFSQMRETDTNLRGKLRKAEQDVLLLNSENMELREHEKEWRQVQKKNAQLTDAVEKMQKSDAAQDRQRSVKLETQLKKKEENLRSLHRKLERLRNQDPLLKFSRLCSDVARMCDKENDAAKESSDDAFSLLQSFYEEEQDLAWEKAALKNGAGARAYVAVVRRLFLSSVPHVNYDALVTIEGDVAAFKKFVEESGFELQSVMGEKYVVAAPASATSSEVFVGPYGVGVALFLSGRMDESGPHLPFKLTAVYPNVSTTLVSNTHRASVHFDTARSSGPGGQAVNVAETQIIAKLLIDGKRAYVAESQDSRSALSNRESATEKLGKAKRQQYNEQLVKQQRIEGVERELVQLVREHVEGNVDIGVEMMTSSTVMEMVQAAVEKNHVSLVDLHLVYALQYLNRKAAAKASPMTA